MDLTVPKLTGGSGNGKGNRADSKGFKYSIDNILNRSASSSAFSNPDSRWQLYRSQLQLQYQKHFLLHHHYLQQQRHQPHPQLSLLHPRGSPKEEDVASQGGVKEEKDDGQRRCLQSTAQRPDLSGLLPSPPKRQRTGSESEIGDRDAEGVDFGGESTESGSGPGCGNEDAITPVDDGTEATIVDVERTSSDVESGMNCV